MRALPIGTSDFPTLRRNDMIYVDKTELIHSLASKRGKFFLARPRRFGKSLLVSTFQSLFAEGLKDFSGLTVERTACAFPIHFEEMGGVKQARRNSGVIR